MTDVDVTNGPKYFQFDQIPWPESEPDGTPQGAVTLTSRNASLSRRGDQTAD